MNGFWETEDGKIMKTLVHDHSGAMSIIRNYIRGLAIRLDKSGEVSNEELKQAIEGVERGVQKAKKALDYSYIRFKEKNQ